MKYIFTTLMLLPLATFAMEGEVESMNALAIKNGYVESMIYPKDQQERDNWQEYCTLGITLSQGIRGERRNHHAHIHLLNKAVGKKFEFSDGGFDWLSYTVKCALINMTNNIAHIRYLVMRDQDQQINTNIIAIAMDTECTEKLFFRNDQNGLSAVRLTLRVTPQNSSMDDAGSNVTQLLSSLIEDIALLPARRESKAPPVTHVLDSF